MLLVCTCYEDEKGWHALLDELGGADFANMDFHEFVAEDGMEPWWDGA